jgi:hypothetical protein
MIKIKWKITDIIENISLQEFDTEYNGIYGYFQICINNQILGFCPDKKLLNEEEGNEDILFWLFKLSDGLNKLNVVQKYEIQLLSMNLAKLVLKKDNKLLISFMNSNTDEIIWSEKIMFQELYNEVKLNIKNFITEIQRINPVILESKLIKNLLKNTFDY